jgi:hypothetical protein
MQHLRRWEKAVNDVDVAWKSLQALFSAGNDSPICAALYDTMMIYTDVLSIAVGDKYAWLDWYRIETDMGRKKMSAKAASWKRERVIGNIEMLCKVIEAE